MNYVYKQQKMWNIYDRRWWYKYIIKINKLFPS